MRRYSGQKALYEAMSRKSSKPKRPSVLARLRPQLEKLRPQLEKLRKLGAGRSKAPASGSEPTAAKPAPAVLKPPRPVEMSDGAPVAPTQTWLRPKAVQINEGRVEVSLPYQIGIIIGMGVVLVALMLFWVGRQIGRMEEKSRYDPQTLAQRADLGGASLRAAPDVAMSDANGSPETVPEAADTVAPETETAGVGTPERTTAATGAVALVRTGDNAIVLARHTDEEQLKPVQEYFRGHGIETRILSYAWLRSVFERFGLDVGRVPKGDGYMLVTFNLYNNPSREGTDGYAARMEIVELGRGYRAPQGFESFATNYFSDAYGMKIAK